LENRMKRQKGGSGLSTLMSANTSSGSSSRSRGIQVQILAPQPISVAPQRLKPLASSGFVVF
ncbi:MAG: hypothetical protein ACKPGI_19090, partial [Verrucomicrobiota bacterium]